MKTKSFLNTSIVRERIALKLDRRWRSRFINQFLLKVNSLVKVDFQRNKRLQINCVNNSTVMHISIIIYSSRFLAFFQDIQYLVNVRGKVEEGKEGVGGECKIFFPLIIIERKSWKGKNKI